MAELDRYLRALTEREGSDLHLAAGQPALIRLHGRLEAMESGILGDSRVRALVEEICTDEQRGIWRRSGDIDFAYELPGVGRFRVNLFVQERGAGAVFRIIPVEIKTVEDLGLAPAIAGLANLTSGLVLVTGPTGSGKSTTLAALIDSINTRRAAHIITIEDPIEFVHRRKQSVISQREVGAHAASFRTALKAAMREDPDVILVGELRDFETISLALTSAEMGTLVFGTLHTNSAIKTVDRIIDAFPSEQQGQARAMLAESLAGVVAQLLIPRADRPGRLAVHEILLRTPALANVIREGNTTMLASVIQSGRGEGMMLMDDSLQRAYEAEMISARDAYAKAHDKKRFEPLMDAEAQWSARAAGIPPEPSGSQAPTLPGIPAFKLHER